MNDRLLQFLFLIIGIPIVLIGSVLFFSNASSNEINYLLLIISSFVIAIGFVLIKIGWENETS